MSLLYLVLGIIGLFTLYFVVHILYNSKDTVKIFPSKSTGKINLHNQTTLSGLHRSGWKFAIESLNELHNEKGILFDGFIEDNFSWRYDFTIGEKGIQPIEYNGILPYKQKWVGIIHNPPYLPDWFDNMHTNQAIFKRRLFKESLKNCAGLWALSEYHAKWLREHLDIPVSVVYHPTDTNVPQFDYNKFLMNKHKKIYQIGWWLRKLNSIYQLPINKVYKKIRLDPKKDAFSLQFLYDKEREVMKLEFDNQYYNNTFTVNHLSNEEYDQIYTENITFVDLYDASANNAVIEAIARATPILINPLPAVIEYLGKDYPFYFNSLEEAAMKALDMNLILETHTYLKNSPMRKKLTGEYFCESIKNSQVYKNL